MKKTKILSLLLIAAIVVAVCVFALPTQADAATSGYYTYEVSEGKAKITSCDESISGDVTIPSELGGYPVTGIGRGAFENCTSLAGVTIPDGVTSIGEYAFNGCCNLTRVTIPEGVTSIGEYAFNGCYNLTSVTIPEGVTSIGKHAFSGCSCLTSVSLPNSITAIPDQAFFNCEMLTSIKIPSGVTRVGKQAFTRCSALEKIFVYSKNCSFNSGCGLNNKQTICGYAGSTAEDFAEKIGAQFVAITNWLKLTKQPANAAAPNGGTVKVKVAATGDGLTYTWYYMNKRAISFRKSSVTKATYATTMNSSVNGRKLYCVVSDKYGNTVTTNTITLYMGNPAKITTQPKSVNVDKGYAAKVTVVATGDGLTYTWYYKNAGASSFSKSSVTEETYGVIMDANVNGRQVYCVVKDKYGISVKSNTVTLSMKQTAKITTQPKNATVPKGRAAKVTVAATGDGLTYTWYYKNAGASSFSKSSVTKATYGVIMDAKVNGRQIYCVVKDKYGNSVKSNTVKLYMGNPAKITTQPKDASAKIGSQVTVTVKATGDGLTYTWYYKNAWASSFSKSSVTKSTYSTTMDSNVNYRQVYCVVKDKYGNSVTSDTVTMTLPNAVKIITQPTSVTVARDSKATVTVKAIGDGLTYTWYYRDDFSFIKSSQTTETYSITMSAFCNGRSVFCEITDKYGNTVRSDTVTLRMEKIN